METMSGGSAAVGEVTHGKGSKLGEPELWLRRKVSSVLAAARDGPSLIGTNPAISFTILPVWNPHAL
jgi:hypothetical protein